MHEERPDDEPEDLEPPEWPDTDPPPIEDPADDLAYLASKHGLLQQGAALTPELRAFLNEVVDYCAERAEGMLHDEAGRVLRMRARPDPFDRHSFEIARYDHLAKLWSRAAEFGHVGPPRTLVRVQMPLTYYQHFGTNEWSVPGSPEDYQVLQHGDDWVVTFTPLGVEVYRGYGPVQVVLSRAPF